MGFFTDRWITIVEFAKTQQLPKPRDLTSIFELGYWAEQPLSSSSPYYLVTGAIIFLGVAGLYYWRSRLQKAQQQIPVYEFALNQLSNILVFVVVISLSYWFFRSQEIDYLSSRLVIFFSLLIAIIWVAVVVFHLWRHLPSKKDRYLEQQRFFRYIPKKKKKDANR